MTKFLVQLTIEAARSRSVGRCPRITQDVGVECQGCIGMDRNIWPNILCMLVSGKVLGMWNGCNSLEILINKGSIIYNKTSQDYTSYLAACLRSFSRRSSILTIWTPFRQPGMYSRSRSRKFISLGHKFLGVLKARRAS